MHFIDPISPRRGQFHWKMYVKKFAWLPVTTDDGYAVWLENYWVYYTGGANTGVTYKQFILDKS